MPQDNNPTKNEKKLYKEIEKLFEDSIDSQESPLKGKKLSNIENTVLKAVREQLELPGESTQEDVLAAIAKGKAEHHQRLIGRGQELEKQKEPSKTFLNETYEEYKTLAGSFKLSEEQKKRKSELSDQRLKENRAISDLTKNASNEARISTAEGNSYEIEVPKVKNLIKESGLKDGPSK